MNKTIKIFTNQVYDGWEPQELSNFLGGSEECVVSLAEAFIRCGLSVTVYHTQKEDRENIFNGVVYLNRDKAQCDVKDVFITFKDFDPWLKGAKGIKNIHWSSEIEKPWGVFSKLGTLAINNIDFFINLTPYHQYKNPFVPLQKQYIIPHGIDIESLDKNQTDKVKNTMLYCSSPDRGLVRLLSDWDIIKIKHPELKLKIAYGWNNFNINFMNVRNFKYQVDKLMNKPGIEYLGALTKDEIEQEYWKAEYWGLPLLNPESELFCLNAVKAQHCGCKPVVNKIGALKYTVDNHIDYQNFVTGQKDYSTSIINDPIRQAVSWDEIVQRYWLPIIESNETINAKKI